MSKIIYCAINNDLSNYIMNSANTKEVIFISSTVDN